MVQFIKRGDVSGTIVEIQFNTSVMEKYEYFDIEIHCKLISSIILKKESVWYETSVRYRFYLDINIMEEVFNESYDKNVNVFLCLPSDVSIVPPENFSYLKTSNALDKMKDLEVRDIHGHQASFKETPFIEPSEGDYIILHHVGKKSPGKIIMSYSYTNLFIVTITFLAVVLGLISSSYTIFSMIKHGVNWWKNKN